MADTSIKPTSAALDRPVEAIPRKAADPVQVVRWTLLFEKAGSFTLPPVTIHWWDVDANRLRKIVLPARTFVIAAAEKRPPLRPIARRNSAATEPAHPHDWPIWQTGAVLLTLLALTFLGYRLWRKGTGQNERPCGGEQRSQSDKDNLCQLPPHAFYTRLLQLRQRWPRSREFTQALHAFEKALLVEKDPQRVDRARHTLCRLLEENNAPNTPAARQMLKSLYPR